MYFNDHEQLVSTYRICTLLGIAFSADAASDRLDALQDAALTQVFIYRDHDRSFQAKDL